MSYYNSNNGSILTPGEMRLLIGKQTIEALNAKGVYEYVEPIGPDEPYELGPVVIDKAQNLAIRTYNVNLEPVQESIAAVEQAFSATIARLITSLTTPTSDVTQLREGLLEALQDEGGINNG